MSQVPGYVDKSRKRVSNDFKAYFLRINYASPFVFGLIGPGITPPTVSHNNTEETLHDSDMGVDTTSVTSKSLNIPLEGQVTDQRETNADPVNEWIVDIVDTYKKNVETIVIECFIHKPVEDNPGYYRANRWNAIVNASEGTGGNPLAFTGSISSTSDPEIGYVSFTDGVPTFVTELPES